MRSARPKPDPIPGRTVDQAIGGSIFAGIRLVFSSSYLIGVCFLILFYTTLATFLYFQQAQLVRDTLTIQPAGPLFLLPWILPLTF